jgi:hypothetical protein
MAHRITRILAMAAALVCVAGAAGGADLKTLTKDLFAVPSTTGNEDMLAAKIRGLLPKGLTVEDAGLGTIAVKLGGTPGPTLILAALDGYGHMVSGITPEGFLTLDRPVPPPHARFDAFLLPAVSTAKGAIQGVVSQPAIHILTQERRRTQVEGFSLEIAYVDIGVRSEKDARAKGVELLDAVTYPAVLTELAGAMGRPGLGTKPSRRPRVRGRGLLQTAGETIFTWAAQTASAPAAGAPDDRAARAGRWRRSGRSSWT